jgi:6-phosphogluconolactonase (cycloisomerase 2 family)
MKTFVTRFVLRLPSTLFLTGADEQTNPSTNGETPRPLGSQGWTRHIVEFVPLWLVMAALAGWFAYGCSAASNGAQCTGGAITGPTTVAVGAQVKLTLTDGSGSGCGDVLSGVTWSATPSGYLSIDNNGNVTGLSATPTTPQVVTVAVTGSSPETGTTYVNKATVQMTVTGPTLQSIAVTDADNGVAAVGTGDQFKAIGTYSDQSTQNLTSYVPWTSSVAAVATIPTGGSTAGLASPLAVGDTLISASVTIGNAPAITGSEVLTVGTLNSISVTDADNGVAPPSSTDQFTATASYAGGTTQNVTALVTWTSGNTSVASFAVNGVTPPGLAVTGVTGTALITATLTAGTSTPVPGTENLMVEGTVPTLVSIAVTPANASVAAGLTQQYTATGTYSSGPNQVLTTGVNWASNDASVATISTSGLATSLTAGTTSITATVGSIASPGVTLTVTPPVLQSVSIAPLSASIQVGQTQAYTATGSYSDGSHQTLTTGVSWNSNPTGVASINTSGVATGVSPGVATISATDGSVGSGNASLMVTAATPPAVSRYLLDLSDVGISVDAIVPGTGQLRASNVLLIPNLENAIAYAQTLLIHPNGQSVYLVDLPSGIGLQIQQYSLSASGMLTAGTSVQNSNWNSNPVMDPLGRFIYVSDFSGNFWVIPLDSSGAPGTPVEALTGATSPEFMAIDPSGTYLYAIAEPTISTYKIGSSGTLTSIGSITGPTGVAALAVAPSGKVVYVLSTSGFSIDAYSSRAGVLTALANSPFSVSSSGDPEQLAIDSSGSFLYVTERSTDGLYGFTIGSDGSLTAMQSGNPFPVGKTPNHINIDAGNHFVYVNNSASSDIWVYSIASGTGLLTNVSEIRTQLSTAQGIVSGTAGLTFTPTALYIANASIPGGTIQQFTIDASTGNLITLSTPIGAGDDPLTVVTDPFGLYAYDVAPDSGSNGVGSVFAYSITSTGLSFTNINMVGAGKGPSWLTTDLSGSFLYVTMQTDTDIWKYDLVSGVPTNGASTDTTSPGPVFVTTEPSGQYVYVANTTGASIDMYKINLPGGSLGPVGSGFTAQGMSQNWIAIDPSGRFAYSADETGNAVWEFTIATNGVLNLNSVPSLPVGASSAKPGVGSVVVEPTGKFLYATNVSLGQIYAFSIDPSTGLLTAVPTSLPDGEVADPGAAPGELAVDISGKYLYCVTTPTAGSGTINIYSIDSSTGLLTSVGSVTNVPFAAGFALTGTVQ